MLSMPKDMVTVESLLRLKSRVDKLIEEKSMNREKLHTDNETPAIGV